MKSPALTIVPRAAVPLAVGVGFTDGMWMWTSMPHDWGLKVVVVSLHALAISCVMVGLFILAARGIQGLPMIVRRVGVSVGFAAGVALLMQTQSHIAGVSIFVNAADALRHPFYWLMFAFSSIGGLATWFGYGSVNWSMAARVAGFLVCCAALFWGVYPIARVSPGSHLHLSALLGTAFLAGEIIAHHVGKSEVDIRFGMALGGAALFVAWITPVHLVAPSYEHSVVGFRLLEARTIPQSTAAGYLKDAKSRVIPPVEFKPASAVVLIVVDTLRVDHVTTEVAPFLVGLRERGVSYSRAYVTAPATGASLASMFSGSNDPDPAEREALLHELEKRGVRVEAVSSHPYFNAEITQVPDTTDVWSERDPHWTPTASEALARARLRFAKLAERNEPFVLIVHVYDPHDEYIVHDGYDFGVGASNRYKSEVAYVDAQLEGFHRWLRERSDATVLVVSDHGEELGDLGYFAHGLRLFDETVRALLVIDQPGLAPQRINDPVSTVDLPNTLLQLLGLAPTLPGGSLVGGQARWPVIQSENYFACVSSESTSVFVRKLRDGYELKGGDEILIQPASNSCWRLE